MRSLPLVGLLLFLGCSSADDFFGLDRSEGSDQESEPPVDDDDATAANDGDDDDATAANDDGSDNDGPPQGDDDEPGDDPEPSTDSAEIVSSSLPSSLACGGTFSATVEVRNLGTATWTRADGYKLGGVDDEDPLIDGDARIWLPDDVLVAPFETYVFDLELQAPGLPGTYVTDWQMVHEAVTWFGETVSSTVAVACSEQTFVDPLTDDSVQIGFASKVVAGGSFSAAGWQTTDDSDQLLLALDVPIAGDGTLEVDVTNFDPTTQYSATKHQIINLYTSDNGSQDVFATDEAWWNVRTGTNYGTGVKLLASPLGGDNREEARLIESATWDPSDVHTWTLTWDDDEISILLDGSLLTTLGFDGRVQPLQHIFLGKDNVYAGQVGPIYSNLRVTYQP